MDEWAAFDESSRRIGSKRRGAAWMCAMAAWLFAAGGAFAAMTDYASRPGAGAVAPTSWPRESRLPKATDRATLVMIAHTKCPCTRASVHELERLMARAGSRTEAFVVFVGPRDEKPGLLDLRETAAPSMAQALADVTDLCRRARRSASPDSNATRPA